MSIVRCGVIVSLVIAAVGPNHSRADGSGSAGAEVSDPPIQKPQNPKALEHLSEGNKLYNLRRWNDAAEEYTKAALVEPAPILDYNLGQCYRQLGKHEDAIWHYKLFVRASPQTPMHVKAAQKFIEDLQAQIDSEKATKNQPPSDPAPMSASSPPDLPPSIAATPSGPAHSPSAAIVVARRDVPPWYADAFGWGLAGVGAAGMLVGGALLLDASGLSDDANAAASQQDRDALHDKASSRQLLGAAIGIAGTGLLVTGVIKLIVHDDERNHTRISVVPADHGVAVFGTF